MLVASIISHQKNKHISIVTDDFDALRTILSYVKHLVHHCNICFLMGCPKIIRLLKCPENSSTGVGSRPYYLIFIYCQRNLLWWQWTWQIEVVSTVCMFASSGSTCYTVYGVVIVSVKGEVNIWVSCFCRDITKEVVCIILNCSFLWPMHCPQRCAPVNDCGIYLLH